MKSIVLIFLIIFVIQAQAQEGTFFGACNDFEGINMCNASFLTTYDDVWFVDSGLPGNIWHRARPNKAGVDSAYSPPNVMITDSVNPYPTNNVSALYCRVEKPSYVCWGFFDLTFLIWVDTDEGFDGLSVENSYDGGLTWYNPINDPHGIITDYGDFKIDTMVNGELAFSGNSNGWKWATLDYTFNCSGNVMYTRFKFFSDSVQTNKPGVMVDNLTITAKDACYEGVAINGTNNNFNVFPNPAKEEVYVEMHSANIGQLTLFDAAGRQLLIVDCGSSTTRIKTRDLAPGLYFLKIKSKEHFFIQKLIIAR